MSEVTGVYDDLNVMITARDALQNRDRIIARIIVDEDVFVLVPADFLHHGPAAVIHFLNVLFFVEARRMYADGFHWYLIIQAKVPQSCSREIPLSARRATDLRGVSKR